MAWRGWSDDVRGVLWRGSNPGMPVGWLSVGIGVLRCGRAAHCEPWGVGRSGLSGGQDGVEGVLRAGGVVVIGRRDVLELAAHAHNGDGGVAQRRQIAR